METTNQPMGDLEDLMNAYEVTRQIASDITSAMDGTLELSDNQVQGFSSAWKIAACGVAVAVVAIIIGSKYRLSFAKGDFRLDLCPA